MYTTHAAFGFMLPAVAYCVSFETVTGGRALRYRRTLLKKCHGMPWKEYHGILGRYFLPWYFVPRCTIVYHGITMAFFEQGMHR